MSDAPSPALTPPPRSRRLHPALPSVALALLATAQIGLELWSRGGMPWGPLLEGRILPALLWVVASPAIVGLGRRWARGTIPGPAELARHGAAFGGWFLLTNLLIRLPRLGVLGWGGLVRDTRAGMVQYAPAAFLLWGVLAWLGRGRSVAAAQVGGAAEAAPSPPPPPPATLAVPGLNRIHLVPVTRIRRLEADGDHVRVHTLDGEHRVRGTLSDFERKLSASEAFVRIHRSHLVNAAHVREVQPYLHGDYVAVVSDGAELRIPRTRRKALERLLGRS